MDFLIVSYKGGIYMSDYSNLTLRNLIDENLLVAAQKKMCNLLNLSVVTIDPEGNMFGEMVNSTPFCQLICSSNKRSILCRKSKLIQGERVLDDRECRVYDCQMGFKNCIAPIIVDDIFLGSVIIGQFFSEGEEYKKNQFNIKKLSRELGLPEDKIQEEILKISIVSKKDILNYLGCCEFLSCYFSEIAMKSITERKLLHQMKEKQKFEEKAEKAELKTLGAQINPHFLFNTLNSITRMAFLENSPNTEEMIYCLSDLLRYNIKQNEEFPTIDSELQNIKRYLFIQCIRYKDRIKYSIDVPDESLGFRIPSMILQPIVENAIIHGLEPKIEGGTIYISGEVKNNNLKIIVKDTGVGISSKKIREIHSTDTKPHMGLGFHGSHHRLNTYFGPDYGLKIRSNENIETIVEINLPCFKELSPSHKS
jgi:two-component system, LytTR family, sensor kinase